MFENWKRKQAEKKAAEEKRFAQEHCPHSYQVVRKVQLVNYTEIWFLYCPVCDHSMTTEKGAAELLLKKQEVREAYLQRTLEEN